LSADIRISSAEFMRKIENWANLRLNVNNCGYNMPDSKNWCIALQICYYSSAAAHLVW